jgi:hypothetical protein
MTLDLSVAIDWISIKLMAVSIVFLSITWSSFAGSLSLIALATTIVYNGIRIYKELKRSKDDKKEKQKDTE